MYFSLGLKHVDEMPRLLEAKMNTSPAEEEFSVQGVIRSVLPAV